MDELALPDRWAVLESPDAPVVIHVPHAGTTIPPEVRSDLLLDDGELQVELQRITDHRTDELALCSRAIADSSVFANRLSRLVVDPERFPDEREEMLAVGMGAVYTHSSVGRRLRADRRQRDARLLAAYFEPYAAAFAALVDRVVERHGACTIIDLHSYPPVPLPYELRPAAHRPGVCIGTDPFHTPAWLVHAASAAFAGIDGGTALDTPFSGTYVPARHLLSDARITSVMIEVRRDLYLADSGEVDPAGFRAIAGRLAALVCCAAPGGQ